MEVVYKALKKNLTCTMGNGTFQYKEGDWIEEDKANVGNNGLHACLNVLDCLDYYSLSDENVYYMSLADGDISEDGWNTRISCTRLKLMKKLDLPEIVAHGMNFIIEHPHLKTTSSYVKEERGIVSNKFIIVRGKNPAGRGKKGDIIGFLQEDVNSSEIILAGILTVDGDVIEEDTFYHIDGKKVGVIA